MALSVKPNNLIGENYKFALKQSIKDLIPEIRKGTSNLSAFVDVFYQLVQARIDPPLEAIWVYSGLSFRGCEIESDDLSGRVLAAKQMFAVISSCSASCGWPKSVALLAPVVLEVYKLFVELLGKDLGGKKVKKVVKKVKSLIGEVIGYISVCCCKDLCEESDSNLIVPIADLVCVWRNGSLDSFFPLLSEVIRREVEVGGSNVSYLAGVVAAEMFLLKLCFDIRVGGRGVELEKELRSWTVGSITSIRNFYFFETLVRMMLEPTIPVTSILSSEDEIWLRKFLYDATILVEYSFLGPEKTVHLPTEHVRSLAVKRLILTHEAIEFFRKSGDRKRAISYTSSFSRSRLHSQIVESINSQVGNEEEVIRLRESSPKAIIKRLLALEGQGIRFFDDSIIKHRAKLSLVGDSKADDEQTGAKLESKKVDIDLLFYIDNQGEDKMVDEDDKEADVSMSAAFVAAAQSMRVAETRGVKRKGASSRKTKRTKSLKNDLSDDDSDSLREELPTPSVNSASSNTESEVEDPVSDDDDM